MADVASAITDLLATHGSSLDAPAESPSKRLVGCWGVQILFTVGLDRILIPDNVARSERSRYATHNIHGTVPRLEWLGPEPTELQMEIYLSTDLGVYVPNCMRTIANAVRSGLAYDLFIGGKKIGANKFVIASVDEKWLRTFSNGEVTHARNTLTFREYWEE